jgi:hypothetical protein
VWAHVVIEEVGWYVCVCRAGGERERREVG